MLIRYVLKVVSVFLGNSQWSEICVSRDKGFRAKSQAITSFTNSTMRYVAPEYAHEYINQLVGIN